MTAPRSHKVWTRSELDDLAEMWGTVPAPAIADKLGRTTAAVQLKAYDLSLGDTLTAGGYVTLNAVVAAITGNDDAHAHDSMARRWIAHGIPVKLQQICEKKIRVVNLDKFWTWAAQHKSNLDFAGFEEYSLGKEPPWVRDKRRADVHRRRVCPKYKAWTTAEESRLAMLLGRRKYTMAQLSELMQRPAESIRHKYQRLGLPGPVAEKQFVHTWTPEDVAAMEAGIVAIKPWLLIGLELGRNTEACKNRARKLYGTSNQDKIRAILAEREKEREEQNGKTEADAPAGAGAAQDHGGPGNRG